MIFFRIDCFELLAIQGTLKSLLQHHSSKASVLWCSAFFIVQLSHACMTAGKIIALTVWTLVSKVMSLLFNTLTRFVIAFIPRSKHLLISWLQSPSTVILEPRKIKSATVSIFFPSVCPDGEGNGNPLQYSCLENPMDGGAWWATVHGVTKSRTQLSDFPTSLLP